MAASDSNTGSAPAETFALETRAEELTLLSRTKAVREGESDQFEIGAGGATDTVIGRDLLRVGGNLAEGGNDRITQASRLETLVDGKMTLEAYSDTTMMAGAMTDVQTGAILVCAGMSDDLVIGGGVRMSMLDMLATGLMGMEENPVSAMADVAFMEVYRVHFEREYGAGIHLSGVANHIGALHTTAATGFRALASVSFGVRNMTPCSASSMEGDNQLTLPQAAALPTADAPRPSSPNSSVLTAADDADSVAEVSHIEDLEDAAPQVFIRDMSGNVGSVEMLVVEDLEDSAGVLEDLRQADDLIDARPPMPLPDEVLDVEDARQAEDATGLQIYATVGDGSIEVGIIEFDPSIVQGDDVSSLDDLGGVEDAVVGALDDVNTLPDDFNFHEQSSDFWVTTLGEYRKDCTPGLAIMQDASDQVNVMTWQKLQLVDPEWLADAGFAAEDVAGLQGKSGDIYDVISQMEQAARNSGDIEKADKLRDILTEIDIQAFTIWSDAKAAAGEIRPTGFVPLPENIDVDSLLADLQDGLAKLQAENIEAVDAGDLDRVKEISQQMTFYDLAIKNINAGYDPTPYLFEMSKTSIMNAHGDVDQIFTINVAREDVFAILADTKHLQDPDIPANFFFDPSDVTGASLNASDSWRNLRGIPENFDFASYHTYLTQLIDSAGDVEVDDLRNALDSIEDGPLAQIDSLPATYIYETGLAADLAAVRESQDPLAAYRLLQDMESFYRSSDEAVDIAKADAVRSIIDSLDALAVDEYTKVYDTVVEISSTIDNAAVPAVLPDPKLGSTIDEVEELDNARQVENPESLYSLISQQNMSPDEAASFDDVQQNLDLSPSQVDVEANPPLQSEVPEQPIYYLAGPTANVDDDAVDPTYATIGPRPDGPVPVDDEIVEAEGATYLGFNLEEGAGEEFYQATEAGTLKETDETSDFTFYASVFEKNPDAPQGPFPQDKADGYQFMSQDELADARGKYKKPTDEWTTPASEKLKTLWQIDDDPLKTVDNVDDGYAALKGGEDGQKTALIWDGNGWISQSVDSENYIIVGYIGDDPVVVSDEAYAVLRGGEDGQKTSLIWDGQGWISQSIDSDEYLIVGYIGDEQTMMTKYDHDTGQWTSVVVGSPPPPVDPDDADAVWAWDAQTETFQKVTDTTTPAPPPPPLPSGTDDADTVWVWNPDTQTYDETLSATDLPPMDPPPPPLPVETDDASTVWVWDAETQTYRKAPDPDVDDSVTSIHAAVDTDQSSTDWIWDAETQTYHKAPDPEADNPAEPIYSTVNKPPPAPPPEPPKDDLDAVYVWDPETQTWSKMADAADDPPNNMVWDPYQGRWVDPEAGPADESGDYARLNHSQTTPDVPPDTDPNATDPIYATIGEAGQTGGGTQTDAGESGDYSHLNHPQTPQPGAKDPTPGYESLSTWTTDHTYFTLEPPQGEEAANSGVFAGYGAGMGGENPNYIDVSMGGENLDALSKPNEELDDIEKILGRRIELIEDTAYYRLMNGYQSEDGEMMGNAVYEAVKLLDQDPDLNGYSAALFDYDLGRAQLGESLGDASDVVMPPVQQPTGLNRPGSVTTVVDEGEFVTVVDFAEDTLQGLPPTTVEPTEAVQELLLPVLPGATPETTTEITRADGAVTVIEDFWESTDPLTALANREPHEIAVGAFEEIELGDRLPRLNKSVNSLTGVSQDAGGMAFSLSTLDDIDEIDMFAKMHWQCAADPVLNRSLHQLSDQGEDVLSIVLGNGGFIGGSVPW